MKPKRRKYMAKGSNGRLYRTRSKGGYTGPAFSEVKTYKIEGGTPLDESDQ